MSFEKLTYKKGRKNIQLNGPDEHPGEHRYSWSVVETTGLKRMFIRVEKLPGISEEYDTHSPIVSFAFVRSLLMILFENPDKVPNHKGKDFCQGLQNPYLNRMQHLSFPQILIPTSMLGSRGVYKLGYETNFRGDFLTLESNGHTIMVNIWAVALLEGVRSVSLDGAFVMEDHIIGRLPTKKMLSMLPFFAGIRINDPDDSYHQAVRFEEESYEAVQQLLCNGRNPGRYPLIDSFRNIDISINGDRQGGSYEERRKKGIADAKKAFKLLFGS